MKATPQPQIHEPAGPPRSGLTDERLAALATHGDRAAIAMLYERHYRAACEVAAGMLRDRDLARDVAQATFIKAWEALEKGTTVRSFRAWFYTMVRNMAVDELRRRRHLQGACDETALDRAAPLGVDAGPGDPEEALRAKQLAELVWHAAERLPSAERSLLELYVRDSLGAEELARALGLEKGAVYTRLSRLRDALKESLVATILTRKRISSCPELQALRSDLGAGQSRRANATLKAHGDRCERCARRVRPSQVLEGLASIPPDAVLS